MASVTLERLTKKFGEVRAVDGLDIRIEDGELLTLLGPSGCGKSTALACIAGLERPSGGRKRAESRSRPCDQALDTVKQNRRPDNGRNGYS